MNLDELYTMQNKIPSVLFILFSSLQLFAQSNDSVIAMANESYSQGNYQEAIGLYEHVLKEDYEAPQLYYNLGNSFFKTNNIPAAILNYERAKRLSPNDEDILFNLKLANLKTVDKTETIPPLFFKIWWNDLANMFSGDRWAIYTITSLWLCIILICAFVISKKTALKKLSFGLSIIFLILTILSFTNAYQRYRNANSQDEAIVFSVSVIVKSSPDENGTDLFLLHEGTKVMIMDEIGEWNKIMLSDGSVGWLRKETVEII
ncbi:MAG: tetratricopeptide repeat protein [Bacteroidota bacterium]